MELYSICVECGCHIPIGRGYSKFCPDCKDKRKHRPDKRKRNDYQREYNRRKSGYYEKYKTRHKIKEMTDDELKEYRHKFYLKQKEKGNLKKYRDKYLKDPQHKIINNLRNRLWCLLNRSNNGLKKYHKMLDIIGCSLPDLKVYLESLFKDGMSWDNYGRKGWHIDHIRPCDSFDITDPEQQKQCFHYTNLQPLWAVENYRKHNKIL